MKLYPTFILIALSLAHGTCFAADDDSVFVHLAAGYAHSAGVRADGTLWSWGGNDSAQLGSGNTSRTYGLIQVGTESDWKEVACGSSYTYALKTNGTLWGWGRDYYGNFGSGGILEEAETLPAQVGTNADWKSLSCGTSHTVGLKLDGSLWAWGSNHYGELGVGDTVHRGVPTRVGADNDWRAVSCGTVHTLAIKVDGSLWAWGSNIFRQLGLSDWTNRSQPVRVGTAVHWQSVSGGGWHTAAVSRDGRLWTWGGNPVGAWTGEPTPVGAGTDWAAVKCGYTHTVATQTDGSVWSWGSSSLGEAGHGNEEGASTPVRLMIPEPASVGCGWQHTVVATTTGELWAWGWNGNGQLGEHNQTNRPVRVLTRHLGEVASFSGGQNHSVALTSDGQLWAWGQNQYYYQLGDGTPYNRRIPVQVMPGTNWKSADAGAIHTLALSREGRLWSWGSGFQGQLGGGYVTMQQSPAQVGVASNWKKVKAGPYHSLAIQNDGSLWAWGRNFYGNVGDGTKADRTAPVQVGTDTDWLEVDGGDGHTLGIKTNGTLWAWGTNMYGQLGMGQADEKLTPTQVGISSDWVAVKCGHDHSLALKRDGSLWAWGENHANQTGVVSVWHVREPQEVLPGKRWKAIAAGWACSFGIQQNGTLWTWGSNERGQLGLGNGALNSLPQQVGTSDQWKTVGAGEYHALATQLDGSEWAWGQNENGELGDGTAWSPFPVRVVPGRQVQTITFEAIPDLAVGESITLKAAASSGLPITRYTVEGPAVVIGDRLTALNSGAVKVRAYQEGDGSWLAALPMMQTIEVVPRPLVKLKSVEATSDRTALVTAVINANGQNTAAWIDYGTTPSYGRRASVVLSPSDGLADQTLMLPLTALRINMLYHVRIGAKNEHGESYSESMTFSTTELKLVVKDGSSTLNSGGLIDMGSAELGSVVTRRLLVRNTGRSEVRNLTWDLNGAGDVFVIAPPADRDLSPGEEQEFSVTYVPTSAGSSDQGSLRLSSGAEGGGHYWLQVQGASAAYETPQVRIEEVGGQVVNPLMPAIDFGSVMMGRRVSKVFKITNLGSTTLSSWSASISEPYGTLYSWDIIRCPVGQTCSMAITWGWIPIIAPLPSGFYVNAYSQPIAPGMSRTFAVEWAPYEAGTKSRCVQIIGNGASIAQIPITATGTAYTYSAPRISGLHYRFDPYHDVLSATESDRRRSYTSSVHAPETYALSPLTSDRWSFSLGSASPPQIIPENWRSRTLSAFQLIADHRFGHPTGTDTSEQGAWQRLGSRSGLEFGNNRYLRPSGTWLQVKKTDRVGMEMWMKPLHTDGAPPSGTQCVAQIGLEDADASFGLWIVDGMLQARAGMSQAAMAAILTSEWHHVAAILDAGKLSLRVDGDEVASVAAVNMPEQVIGFTVGAIYNGGASARVQMDELRLFELPADFDPAQDLLTGGAPQVQADASRLEFGPTPVGRVVVNRFRLTNSGAGWLRIRSAVITGESAGDFVCKTTANEPLQPDRPNLPNRYYGESILIPYHPQSGKLVVLESGTQYLGNDVVATAVAPDSSMEFTVTYVPSSSGPRSAKLTLLVDDPAKPVIEIDLAGQGLPALPAQLMVSAQEWNWGTANIGESRSSGFYLQNTGGAALSGIRASIVGPNATDYTLTQSNFDETTVLRASRYQLGYPTAPVASHVTPFINVSVRPVGNGLRVAWLRITSSDPVRPVVEIPLYGRGAISESEVTVLTSPTSADGFGATENQTVLSLGSVFVGRSAESARIRIQNTGSTGILLSHLKLYEEFPGDYTISPQPTAPQTLFSYSGQEFSITFHPRGMGNRSAKLVIVSDDADEPVFTLHFQGSGRAPVPVLELAGERDWRNGYVRMGTAVVRDFRNPGDALPRKTLSIVNSGMAPLRNARLSLTGDAATDFTATFSGEIAAGDSGQIELTFDPTELGVRSATLHIEAGGTTYSVLIAGTGACGAKATLTPHVEIGWVTNAMAQLSDERVVLVGDRGWRIAERTPSHLPDAIAVTGFSYSSSFNGPVTDVEVAADDAIYMVGAFNRILRVGFPTDLIVGQPAYQGVARVNQNGQFDDTFRPPPGDFVGRAVVVLPSGKILVGGSGKLGRRRNLILLNTDGSLDETFRFPEPNDTVNALALQADGKVVIGGEFTNLGQAYVPGAPHMRSGAQNPTTLRLRGNIVDGSEAGLCRMTADGSVDNTLGNPGFFRVTSLAAKDGSIAVGGEELRHSPLAFAVTISGSVPHVAPCLSCPPLTATPSLQPAACLLAETGQVIASEELDSTPTAVAMLPGRRMLVASNSATSGRPSVDMIQRYGQSYDFFGVKEVSSSDVFGGFFPPYDRTVQRFTGGVRALLPSTDGKVLVGGSITAAQTVTFPWSEPLTESAPSQVNGVAELDTDGFYNTPVSVVSKSDGLSLVTLAAAESSVFADVIVPAEASEITIDGPHADDFRWSRIPTVGGMIRVVCRPSSVGPRRAVLHIAVPGNGNAFDIGLVFDSKSSKPDRLAIISPEVGDLSEGGTLDFGFSRQGKSAYRALKLHNRGDTPIEALPITIAGGSGDFEIDRSPKFPIRPGGESAMLLRFSPVTGTDRERTATLSFGGNSQLGNFPLQIALAGTTVPDLAFTQQPQDTLVFRGSPFQLSAQASDVGPLVWRWSVNGETLRHSSAPTYDVVAAKLSDAGVYRAKVTSGVLHALSRPARVAVVDSVISPSVIRLGVNRELRLTVNAKGEQLTFQWVKDGVAMVSHTQRALRIPRVTEADAGRYACQVTSGSARLITGAAHVEVVATGPGVVPPTSVLLFQVGQTVNYPFVGINEVERWSARGLPPGLVIDASTGLLSGRPTLAGSFAAVVTAANAAGSASQAVTIQISALPAGLIGSYTGSLHRGSFNDFLGGSLDLAVNSSGAFTARARSGLVTYVFKGTLLPDGSGTTYEWSGVNVFDPSTPATLLHITWQQGDPTLLIGTSRFNDDYGNAVRHQRVLSSRVAGEYNIVSSENPGSPSIAIRTTVQTTGTVRWVATIEEGADRTALTGVTQGTEGSMFRLFGTHPANKRPRSVTGGITLDGSDASVLPLGFGFVEYGNNLNAETNPATGAYFHSWEVQGNRLP